MPLTKLPLCALVSTRMCQESVSHLLHRRSPAGGTADAEVPLERPAREAWLARRKQAASGRAEVTWKGLDAAGRTTAVNA